jgi:3'-phosphoadenosine 5'-phosphosulfate sulfotransferase (PAPS reductase)/FAD synthetase
MKHPLYSQVAKYITGQLTLPEAKPGMKQFFLVPVSSGIDSTAVAIVLKVLYPDMPFTYVFTDTGNEIAGTEEALDRLEAVLGVKIIRIRPKVSLLDKVEAQGNYLPSPRQRYCTQIGKIAPFKQFMAALKQMHGDNTQFVSFVGVRADEPEREGVQWADENAVTVFPLQQLGFDKAAVNKLVQEVTGIPIYYANKSRSGCALCINSRRSEDQHD